MVSNKLKWMWQASGASLDEYDCLKWKKMSFDYEKKIFVRILQHHKQHVISYPEPSYNTWILGYWPIIILGILGFLSLKRGCTCSSESTHIKIPHCWKSHVVAHLFALFHSSIISSVISCVNLFLRIWNSQIKFRMTVHFIRVYTVC